MVAIASSTLERMTTTVKILDLMDLNIAAPPLRNDVAIGMTCILEVSTEARTATGFKHTIAGSGI
jgi:hypothetical protein